MELPGPSPAAPEPKLSTFHPAPSFIWLFRSCSFYFCCFKTSVLHPAAAFWVVLNLQDSKSTTGGFVCKPRVLNHCKTQSRASPMGNSPPGSGHVALPAEHTEILVLLGALGSFPKGKKHHKTKLTLPKENRCRMRMHCAL